VKLNPAFGFPRLAASGRMNGMNGSPIDPAAPRQYRWPWFVLAFVVVGVVIAVFAVRREALRVKSQRMPAQVESTAPAPTP
jgi:hypothetical protein